MDKNSIIESLYRDHKDHIYNFLARMADDPDLALDVTQQTFVKALSDKNIHRVENPKAWLFTIARNTLYNEFKRKKATSLDALVENDNFEAIDNSEGVQDKAEVKDIQVKVEKSIRRMPAKTKELMILRYTEDLSIKEISHITGRTLSDVKVNLHRARIKFETSFTSEMYARVAIARDQCDTLTTLLTPYIDSDIPEQDLQRVDKHITGCKICHEDTEQLKRSRTLFNFAALLSAPYILDRMMGEAMASELNFFSTTNTHTGTNSASAVVDSASRTASATHAPTNIISLKAASIIAASVILTIAVIVTLLINDENDATDPAARSLTSPSSITASPSPAVPKTKLDPDITTIVSFKARNEKTGKDIKKGLQWHIFNIADSNGAPLSGGAESIKTSDTARFEMILNSGYYLAKVTYRGQTLESEFAVKDDDPVNIQLEFSSVSEAPPETARAAQQEKTYTPTIHIRRMETGTYESKPIKVSWDLCVESIKMYKEIRAKHPDIWAIQEKSLIEQNPEFNLDRGLAPEPDWPKLTQNYEDEYFSGDKYALYSEKTDYDDVSEDGSCKLSKTTSKTAEIDDGEFSYFVDFDNRIAEKNISKVVLEKEVKAMYQNFAENNPLAQMAGKLMTEAMLGKAGSAQEQQSIKAIKDLEALTEVAGTETMAGETCEYTVMGEQSSVRICYWKTMHEYPSIVKRPIILGSTVELDKNVDHPMIGNQITRAILFEKDITLDDSIFSVPAGIKIDDTNYNEMMQEGGPSGNDQ
ncbi:MAG TPA: sigma-70 family RNA polymerase sigma factor [Gammaproteobacteria bacterium]|nr:sigma-70 family RNA polymerase sigma factor [Gammaproteobacteria bacterium]